MLSALLRVLSEVSPRKRVRYVAGITVPLRQVGKEKEEKEKVTQREIRRKRRNKERKREKKKREESPPLSHRVTEEEQSVVCRSSPHTGRGLTTGANAPATPLGKMAGIRMSGRESASRFSAHSESIRFQPLFCCVFIVSGTIRWGNWSKIDSWNYARRRSIRPKWEKKSIRRFHSPKVRGKESADG